LPSSEIPIEDSQKRINSKPKSDLFRILLSVFTHKPEMNPENPANLGNNPETFETFCGTLSNQRMVRQPSQDARSKM
jgi:hypothetical protein